jgi:hypothetical protein
VAGGRRRAAFLTPQEGCHHGQVTHRGVDREALIGVAVAGGFGIGWAFWAASGLSGGAAAVVRIAGVVIGVIIVAAALFRRTAARPSESASSSASEPMFRSRGYRVSVAAELIALVVGNVVLGATGHSAYVAAWTALVVGVHFLGFGRLFAPVFYWLGAAFIAAAIAGAAVGAAGGTRQAVEASTGLIAAGSLFVGGAWGLLAAVPLDAPPTAR